MSFRHVIVDVLYWEDFSYLRLDFLNFLVYTTSVYSIWVSLAVKFSFLLFLVFKCNFSN